MKEEENKEKQSKKKRRSFKEIYKESYAFQKMMFYMGIWGTLMWIIYLTVWAGILGYFL